MKILGTTESLSVLKNAKTNSPQPNIPMVKLTVIYGHPTDPEAFEKYYATTQPPLVEKMKGVEKAELTKFMD